MCTYVSKRWGCACRARTNQFIDYYIIKTVIQCRPASPARAQVWVRERAWIYSHVRPTHVLFPDARRNYLQEAAWVSEKSLSLLTKSRSCVYISRTCGESLAIIAYDTSSDDDKWETLLSRSAAIIKFITWHFYTRDTGFYDYSIWLTVLQVSLTQRSLFIDGIS